MSEVAEILFIGLEGGGGSLKGEVTDQGMIYWFQGSQIGLDDADEEIWTPWTTSKTPNIEDALPRRWYEFYPTKIHPDFLDTIRALYLRSATGPSTRNKEEWKQLFGFDRLMRGEIVEEEGSPPAGKGLPPGREEFMPGISFPEDDA